MNKLLTFPEQLAAPPSARAKAMLFHDPRSTALLKQVERIALSDATVLVTGDTGTGKELIARHIHVQSGRTGPFIAVNCGAFCETLVDAELFGHEVGAFTGATHARSGWFEAANGGTLFLDEIGELPASLQVKLLRVLQERQVVRLGSRRPIPLDVRLVAATNVDLQQAIFHNRFRADLYYRLSVATVNMLSLRARSGDILPLARHFIETYSTRLHLEGVTLSVVAQKMLEAYDWPGNIRELENVIHYALIVCDGNVIIKDDLKLAGNMQRSPNFESHDTAEFTPTSSPQRDQSINGSATQMQHRLEALIAECIQFAQPNLFETVEKAVVHTAFAGCNQNQVQTAKVLGVTRNMLRTHLKRFGLIG
ncbi:sigma-54 dependent transcriptional regulator [Glaciimonas sp. CA11.2]|uniref:sigma-54 interaction domain-containing protein n=2 Tax=Glaciimonas sp. CA11.2 TaxID=3048601 RepID=UPI002AB59D9D|nr:sigma-54 dependent transcriptional regulator [Glaciimonas sp. CA11.2]MDY7548177.1 sigma-54 dependent transcriptional regulator [Glaciimonas sp. CA11.2]